MNEGKLAEEIAAEFLKKQGLILVEKNYHCRYGEIDLIAKELDVLVFVEVKLRRSDNYGGAVASITQTKQKRLIATARSYLSMFKKLPSCRFDAILLKDLSGQNIEWVKNIIDEN